jgi:starvation-inducible DNA-binding protein
MMGDEWPRLAHLSITHAQWRDDQRRGVGGRHANRNRTKEKAMKSSEATGTRSRHAASVDARSDLGREAVVAITKELRPLLADVYALYLKTKNFHWHMTGRNFRDYHLLLDEQATQIYEMTDDIAERARKLGGATIRSIGDISRNQRLKDNDAETVTPREMMAELRADNQQLTRFLRAAHEVCQEHNDVATTSLIENWIDETERRTWFLTEIERDA